MASGQLRVAEALESSCAWANQSAWNRSQLKPIISWMSRTHEDEPRAQSSRELTFPQSLSLLDTVAVKGDRQSRLQRSRARFEFRGRSI